MCAIRFIRFRFIINVFFKNEIFVGALVNNFVSFMGMMGSVFLIPVFAQSFLGYSATESGYLFIPMAFMIMFASPIGGSFVGKVAPKWIIFISSLVAAVGPLPPGAGRGGRGAGEDPPHAPRNREGGKSGRLGIRCGH